MYSPANSGGNYPRTDSGTNSAEMASNEPSSGASLASIPFRNGSLKSPRGIRRPSENRPVAMENILPTPLPTAAQLVDKLLQAKRNLSAIAVAVKANEIAGKAGTTLETGFTVHSKAQFQATIVQQQLRLILAFKDSWTVTRDKAAAQFRQLNEVVDMGTTELQTTMAQLAKVGVERTLRPKGESSRTLLDFMEHSNIDQLVQGCKSDMENVRAHYTEFASSIDVLNDLLAPIPDLVSQYDVSASSKSLSPAAATVTRMSENHGDIDSDVAEIAGLLTGLISHYDHCLAAVRYVPEALTLLTTRAPDIFNSGVETEVSSSLQPESLEEFRQLVSVLNQDARQAEEGPAKIDDLHRRIQAKHEEMQALLETLITSMDDLLQACVRIADAGDLLGQLSQAEREFVQVWSTERLTVSENMKQMRDLKLTCDEYKTSYYAVLIEADRRRAVEEKIHKVFEKAQREALKLAHGDHEDVNYFKNRWGSVLPKDLWPMLETPMVEFNLVATHPEAKTEEEDVMLAETDGGYRMPRLKREILARAFARPGVRESLEEKNKQEKERSEHRRRDREQERER